MSKANQTNTNKIKQLNSTNFHDGFLKSIDFHPSDLEACSNWKGGKFANGYGQVRVWGMKSPQKAHRVAWLLAGRDIPDGMILMHKCDNRLCCNLAHLRLGTHQENTQDAIQKGRFQTKRPRTPASVKQAIRVLRAVDPKVWTIVRLSEHFKLNYLTVSAILEVK
jgi:hypothetical protein